MPIEFKLRTHSNDEALVKERRGHIVNCCTRVFAKKGYSHSSMRELAKACCMSIGNLYHYFGSKEQILYSIINDATLRQVEYIEHFSKETANLDPASALRKLIRYFFEWHDANQNVTLFIYQETRALPQKAQEQIFESEGRIQAIFEEAVKRGMQSGDFDGKDPGLIANNIMVLGHAWALRRWSLQKRWTFDAFVKGETESIMSILQIQGGKQPTNRNYKKSASLSK
ncbi:MAG: TetR/AcrR family transcriptional regulator [Dehalococcoidia bacterium]